MRRTPFPTWYVPYFERHIWQKRSDNKNIVIMKMTPFPTWHVPYFERCLRNSNQNTKRQSVRYNQAIMKRNYLTTLGPVNSAEVLVRDLLPVLDWLGPALDCLGSMRLLTIVCWSGGPLPAWAYSPLMTRSRAV